MATERQPWRPDWVVAPGEILLDALRERGMTQAELARRTDRPLKTINEIAKGKAAILPETALQLELVLGVPAGFWLNLERMFAEGKARVKERAQLETDADWLRRFPLAALRKAKVLSRTAVTPETLTELLRFFGVSSPAGWNRHWTSVEASFRKSATFDGSTESLCAWLRLGERQAETISIRSFRPDALEDLIPELRALTHCAPFVFLPKLRTALADVGVRFVLVRELPRCHVSGVARWLRAEEPLVQLSNRHKTDDHFWFTLFHELAHLMSTRADYLDVSAHNTVPNEEQRADERASQWLVEPAALAAFVERRDFRASQVEAFAKAQGIASGIVVGALEHNELVTPGPLRHLKRSIKWPDDTSAL